MQKRILLTGWRTKYMTYSERCFEEYDEEGYPLWLLNFGYKEF